MGRAIHRLSARFVATVTAAGYHADGGGLYLQATATGAKSWVLRYKRLGKAREMGLGSAQVVSLVEARQAAVQARKVLQAGKDPITERKAALAAGTVTWGWCADRFIDAARPGWKNADQAEQWSQSLRDHGPDRDLPVDAITTQLVLSALSKIWADKTETATRVRGRIERIWDWAKVSGYVTGENPARWRGHLDKLLPKPTKVKRVTHHAAMPYRDLPAFMRSLTARDGLARRALRFTILTAGRTAEVTLAQWGEFDLTGKIWNRPAEHMKAGRPHRVPLVDEAVAILRTLPRSEPPFPLSENGMLNLLQKHMAQPYTVHGFRSSFRDWAAEETDFAGEVAEMALAHVIGDQTEAAYRRGDLLEKRRELMRAWADYLAT